MTFRNVSWRLAFLLLPLGLVTGCKDESVGDKIEEAGNDVKREVEDAVD